ncbi:hypothetical protein Mgra_00000905 [Meloidogyne graminicola]|uniref:RH1 domain-containing protein n=1 Tax=Meloidogyne graminicola TaxID=189291 RepID=A0A8T0A2P1_9BILA|nr:hypothetical protein Mgra_00000905 [Meloidogyne graminicola]
MSHLNSVYSLSSSPSKQLTVIDVYDLAESINRDFEILVEKFGNESFESIVGKVISALETLEALAKYNDKDNNEIIDLQKSIERFEHEKQQRMKDKELLERDFIELEEGYKKEIEDLCKIIQKLQVENKCMKEKISSGAEDVKSGNDNPDYVDEQLQALIDLRKMTHTQKDQIKQLQKDLDTYCCEVESLRENIERLIRQNKELLRKNGSLQKQGRMLLLERAEILKRLQQSEENTVQLRRVLNETNRACKDLEVQKQWDEESVLSAIKGQQSPRFSLSELRDVLQEKNALKVKVLELEEQIRASSPGGEIESNRGTPSPNLSLLNCFNYFLLYVCFVCSLTSSSFAKQIEHSQLLNEDKNKTLQSPPQKRKEIENSEECLVFGPINREPDEKLHPWKYERMNSGVRRFFRLFASISSTNLSSRRASAQIYLTFCSTLAKF